MPNVQYRSRNTVRNCVHDKKQQLCPHISTRYRRKINKSINYYPETVKKLSSSTNCSFILSLPIDGFTMHAIE